VGHDVVIGNVEVSFRVHRDALTLGLGFWDDRKDPILLESLLKYMHLLFGTSYSSCKCLMSYKVVEK
jgi:hypothetical protein